MKVAEPREIRGSVLAGTWYPRSPGDLKRTIDEYLARAAGSSLPGELLGLIVPHAGYMYSGPVAAHAYRQLSGRRFDAVVIVGPSHYDWYGSWAVDDLAWWETPLGMVPVDRELTEAVDRQVGLNRVRREREHSLEIQLPFLQCTVGTFSIVPIMMSDQSPAACNVLADGLATAIRESQKKVLLVASSDLSHFHTYDVAVRLDAIAKKHVDAFDPAGLVRAIEMGQCEACGGGPTAAVMLASKALGATGARVLRYANSGDVVGDRSRVVGYLAAAIYRQVETP